MPFARALFLRRLPLSALTHGLLAGMILFWITSSGALVASGQTGASQGRSVDSRGQIRVDVNLVNVMASVLDRNNRPAPDLTRDQFEIYEEGKLQKIEVFEPETQQPLDLALMVDASLSEMKDLQLETEAAARFIAQVVRPAIAWRFSNFPMRSPS